MAAKRTTILQIIPELDTGGAELSTVEIADAVVKAGAVRSSSPKAAVSRHASQQTAVNSCLCSSDQEPATHPRNARVIAHMIREQGVDLVHARSRAPAWSARIAADKAGVPFVTTYHGAYNEKGSLKTGLQQHHGSRPRCHCQLTLHGRSRACALPTPMDRIRVIYRGVDGTRFDPTAVAESRVRSLRKACRSGRVPDHPPSRSPDGLERPERRHRGSPLLEQEGSLSSRNAVIIMPRRPGPRCLQEPPRKRDQSRKPRTAHSPRRSCR